MFINTVFNNIIHGYLKYRYKELAYILEKPIQAQADIFKKILHYNLNTQYAKDHGLSQVDRYAAFQTAVPINTYENLVPYIDRMMMGESNVLCRGKVKWYAKSSGTTNDRSKYIPVTNEFLFRNHIKGNWDMVSFLYRQLPETKIFARKNLLMGGTLEPYKANPKSMIGDISAITIKHIPPAGRPVYTPDFETALLPDWEEKIDKMADICAKEDVSLLAGVPTWSIVLLNKILEKTGKKNMHEVWPDVEYYVHGGVSFEPYRETFKTFFPSKDFHFLEVYNASEGFFALQDELDRNDMLLLVDNQNFFEFIELSKFHNDDLQAIPLEEVQVDIDYVILVSNRSGLWRYIVGDTIQFTSTLPFRMRVTGRTQQYINTFGEELMVHNVEQAIADLCKKYKVHISEYTVAPSYMNQEKKGCHDWLIEFVEAPREIMRFAEELDKKLQSLNADYEAKRYKSMALENLNIELVPPGTFLRWQKKEGKYGGQNKIPRLSPNRQLMEAILSEHKIVK